MVWNCGAPHLKFSLCVEIHAQGNPRIGLKINCEFFKICTNTDIHNGSITTRVAEIQLWDYLYWP